MSEKIRAEVRRFVEPRFPQHHLGDDDDMFAQGFVNSLFAMELVLLVEQLLGTRIPNHELNFDNFRTVDAIVELVHRVSSADPANVR